MRHCITGPITGTVDESNFGFNGRTATGPFAIYLVNDNEYDEDDTFHSCISLECHYRNEVKQQNIRYPITWQQVRNFLLKTSWFTRVPTSYELRNEDVDCYMDEEYPEGESDDESDDY